MFKNELFIFLNSYLKVSDKLNKDLSLFFFNIFYNLIIKIQLILKFKKDI